MIRITDLSLPFDHNDDDLKKAVLRRLKINKSELQRTKIIRRSLDARKKKSIKRVYTLHVQVNGETSILKDFGKDNRISRAKSQTYQVPYFLKSAPKDRPVIVGTGPAGLFAGLILAEAGCKPLLLERGKKVNERARDTYKYWKTGELNPDSNVQFGEGGAGTFSDGKLQTRVKDKKNRDKKILRELVEAGAPEEILYNNKPHLGTAKMVNIVRNLREKIISLNGEFRFQSRVDDFMLHDNMIKGLRLNTGEEIFCETIILAIGHSARDTFSMLSRNGVALEPKPFSIGFRIEHPQEIIDKNQFGDFAGHPLLGAADYQLAYHSSSGRTVYSFCMCPGGSVIAAASEDMGVVTNGMSQFARDQKNANSAIVAEVYPTDFPESPLGGIEYQRLWEQKAYQLGGGDFKAPGQLLGDFIKGRPSLELGQVLPSYQPGIVLSDLQHCLPDYVVLSIKEALPEFERRIKGFTLADAVLTGVETRTSAPLRILRRKDYQSISTPGLYPAGEGSGYSGGILSSAMDGIKAAEAVMQKIRS